MLNHGFLVRDSVEGTKPGSPSGDAITICFQQHSSLMRSGSRGFRVSRGRGRRGTGRSGTAAQALQQKKLRKIRTLFTVRAGVEASAQWAVAPHRKAMSYLSVPSE